MTITISTKTYTKDSNPTPDSARYTGPAHTATTKDQVTLKRSAPKPTKDFAGVMRVVEKTEKTVVINGVPRVAIGETNFSYPVGTLAADITALRVDHSSLVANATVTGDLVDKAKLEF